jgi:hypothetical protein
MNERIEQLARQVDAGYIPRYDMWQMDSETVQKFAELIVRECIMAMCKTAVGNADYNTGRLHCFNNIKEHFGVEE